MELRRSASVRPASMGGVARVLGRRMTSTSGETAAIISSPGWSESIDGAGRMGCLGSVSRPQAMQTLPCTSVPPHGVTATARASWVLGQEHMTWPQGVPRSAFIAAHMPNRVSACSPKTIAAPNSTTPTQMGKRARAWMALVLGTGDSSVSVANVLRCASIKLGDERTKAGFCFDGRCLPMIRPDPAHATKKPGP